MKNLFLGTICLLMFAIAITLVQISCSKTGAQPQTSNSVQTQAPTQTFNQTEQVNKIVFVQLSNTAPKVVFRICNYDGSNVQNLNVTLPAGYACHTYYHPALSPDATKLFFQAYSNTDGKSIFVCDTSGANLVKIADMDAGAVEMLLGGAY